jgi:hypothetical protein
MRIALQLGEHSLVLLLQVLLSDLIDDPSGKFLKVKLIQKKSCTAVKPAYFFDAGAKVEWIPNPEKLSTSPPGVKIAYAHTAHHTGTAAWPARAPRPQPPPLPGRGGEGVAVPTGGCAAGAWRCCWCAWLY